MRDIDPHMGDQIFDSLTNNVIAIEYLYSNKSLQLHSDAADFDEW